MPSARENLYRGLRAWPFLNTAQRRTGRKIHLLREENPINTRVAPKRHRSTVNKIRILNKSTMNLRKGSRISKRKNEKVLAV